MWPVDSVQFTRCFETLSSFPNLSQQSTKSNSRCAKCCGLVNASAFIGLSVLTQRTTDNFRVALNRGPASTDIASNSDKPTSQHSLDENRVYSVLLYCLASHPIQFERRSS